MCVNWLRTGAQRSINRLINLAITFPWLIIALGTALAGYALWYTVTHLEFVTSRNALVSQNAPYIQADEAIDRDFGAFDYAIVVVEPPNLERGKQFVRTLATRLHADTEHFDQVIATLDTSSLEGKKLLYLTPDELRTLGQRLNDAQDLMTDWSETPGIVPLLNLINQEISRALVSHLTGGLLGVSALSDSDSKSSQALDITFLNTLFTQMTLALEAPDRYTFRSPWSRFFLDQDETFSQDHYLTSKHDRFLFILVDFRAIQDSFVKYAAPLAALRGHIETVRQDFPDVQAGVTGGDALSSDEMSAARQDTMIATGIALISVAILFIVAFRQIWRPLLVVLVLIIGLCWTLGFTTLTVAHLNILSVSFLPILIGLGIDFGIHLLARYGEERARGLDFDTALHSAYRQSGPSVIAAAITTALAFYAVMLADFRGLAELGFITGSGMLLCLFASFTVLPALLAAYERHRQVPAGVWKAFERDPLRGLMRFPWVTASVLGLMTIAGLWFLPLPTFDYNLLNLQAKQTESVTWEYRLHEGSGHSSWYALSTAPSLERLRQKQARFEALPVVERVDSVAALLPEDQDVRLPLVQQLAPYVEDIDGNWTDLEPIQVEEVQAALQKIRFKLQRDPEDWESSSRPSTSALASARASLDKLQEKLRRLPASQSQAVLQTFQQDLTLDFADQLAFLKRNVHPTEITVGNIPNTLKQRFIGKSGQYLLQIFSRDNIWERDAMRDFVTQLQTIDPNVTGPPVVAFHSIRQIQYGYLRAGFYAFAVIIGVILVLVRRLKPLLLALLPVFLGGLWTMIGMELVGLSFNMANLIILPLFLGIAVDGGIHMVHRMLEEPRAMTAPLTQSTGKAIVLTSLTTMAGFGGLLVARHSGIFSLGLLSTLAVGCNLVATIVALPLIFHLLPPRMRHLGPQHSSSSPAISKSVPPSNLPS